MLQNTTYSIHLVLNVAKHNNMINIFDVQFLKIN